MPASDVLLVRTTLLSLSLLLGSQASAGTATPAAHEGYVGAAACADCHTDETAAWQGSHHDLAMALPNATTVLGDFDDAEFTAHGVTSRFYQRDGDYWVRTDGPDGALADYRVRYTFGWYPLQQYLLERPQGRLQGLGIAWDSRPAAAGGQRWFHLYPDEPIDHTHALHWTGREQNWNYQCAECHSTDLRKGYDPATDSYQTHYAEIDVACEACHGPGAGHLAWAQQGDAERAADPRRGFSTQPRSDRAQWLIDPASGLPRRSPPRREHTEIEICARCHARRGQLSEDYRHGEPLAQTHRLALLEPHLYYPDGQIKDEVYVYGSFVQSRMYHAGVTCSDCHDPHSQQLQRSGNAVCTSCHVAAQYDTPRHHHHPADGAGAACTGCHMPQRVYMVNDWRADHSFRVPRPDLSVSLGTPNACTGCHTDQDAAWAAAQVVRWYPDSRHRGPHFGEALHAADRGAPDAAAQLLALAADSTQPAIARASAIERLRPLASADQLPRLRRLLEDDSPLVRAAGARYLEATDLRTRVDLGWPLLDDPVLLVRIEAARVLAPVLRQQVPERFRELLTRRIEEYAQTLSVTAERPESHLNLGLVASAVGDAAQAEQSYQTALRLQPDFAPAYANLADLYRALGRDDDGEAHLRAGIAAAPDSAALSYALGLLLIREQRLPEALPQLARAVALAPSEPRYPFVQALALEQAGETDQAREVLREAVQHHPNDADIRAALERLAEK